MTVYLVGAGPGDPGLLTRRGAQLLAQADVVMYDRLVHRSIIELAPDSALLLDVGKRPDNSGVVEDRQGVINQLLVEHGRQKGTVIRLKGGDPFLFGRGGEETDVLTQAGVPWQVVPGVSSALAVPAAAGIPVTHRGLAASVTIVTGRVGDPSAPGGVDWAALAKVEGTLVILMGMATRAEIALALREGGKPGSTPTTVIERGTTAQQRVVRTTLDGLADVAAQSPAVIVVGPVAALGGHYGVPALAGPLEGRTVVVTRSGPRAHGLVAALQAQGATTIEMPLTTQTDPADGGTALRQAAAGVSRFAWVVFTSANAVNRFMAELRDARALGSTLVAAVGPATADALRMDGVEPDLVPAEHWAPGLVDVFPPAGADAPSIDVLFPCADQAPSTLRDGLAEKGWTVHRVEAYRTVALPPPDAAMVAAIARADAVTFTATSSAKAFAALRDADGAPLPPPSLVVCIGPTTTDSARALGMPRVETAWGASTEGIVEALVHHLAGARPDGP
ncbi:MAG TPA: uroporphyrinogen-III C-methyltransferase [Acidimicrobiales bacterium]|jgi:uroporphyrinogen III methyltransferase/synthase|nr:uroporphyrinogen-III C-methyltransferase [Acidimicrobiales bacterium]